MAKILRSYPRLSYVFSFILYLNTYFCCSISELCNWCECRRKGQFLEAFWSRGWQCIKMDGTSRHCNVATSPRRDVPTSRRWVNIYRSQQAATSRRLNVVTSQRRDVATSRRQREFCLSIIKSKKGSRIRWIGDRGEYELGHGNHNSSDFDLGEEPVICIFLLHRSTDV